MEATFSKPRRPWIAALLSLLIGTLGQIYAGRLRRSLCLWLLGGCLFSVLAVCTITLPIGRFGLALLALCVLVIPAYFVADAFLLARRNRFAPLKRYQRWWFYVLFFFVFVLANSAVAHFIRSFIGEAFVVPTRGMSPTIQPGDRFMVDKLWCKPERIRRNDVVVFRSEGPRSPLFVRRIVGLPGDEIEIKNERVFVNGKEWDDQHAVFNGPLPCVDMVNHKPIKVPSDCFFVLGDNRRMSKDSRLMGAIPMSDLYGIARFIYWSHEREFPDPHDTTHYVLGPIHWDRMGLRLD
jgi:signal peptidase I